MLYSDVLRIRPFRDLWLGQAISQAGDAFYYVSFMFMVKKVTGSTAMVGYTGALESIPYLLMGPYAGVLADRIDRRKIMLASDVASGLALTLFALFLLGVAKPPALSILLLAFITSSIRCFFIPAKGAAVPAIVPANLMLKANSLSMMTQNLMPIMGLTFSAGVLAILYAISPTWFFVSACALNALSFYFSAYFIAKLPPIVPDRTASADAHPMADFREGLRYVRGRHDLKVLIAMLTVFRLSVAPFFVAYVAANDQWWGGPAHQGKPSTLAWMELSFFIGMVVASPLVGRLKIIRPAQWFCFALAVVGVCVAAMAFSPLFWAFFAWNTVCGLAVPVADLPINTYMQVSVPDAFRGRTNSVLNMIATGVMPIGMVLGGLIVERYGLTACFLGMGIGMTGA